MKKMNCLLMLVSIVSLFSLGSCKKKNNTSSNTSSYVETFNDDRMVFTFHEDTDSYSIRMNPLFKDSNKAIIIPTKYNEKNVTEIEENAFKDYEYLSELVVPNKIQKIGKGALKGCVRLQTLTLPYAGESKTSNTYLGYLFGESKYTTYIEIPPYLSSITITDASEIGDGAFYGFEALENIILNNGIKKIGNDVFNRCNNLRAVVLPNSIEEIGNYAFKDCENLEAIYIPDSINKVGEEVFKNCNSLKKNFDESSNGYYLGNGKNKYLYLVDLKEDTSIITPNVQCRIISLVNKSFSNIQTINITKNVKNIEISSNDGWSKLTDVSVDSNNTVYDSRNNCNAIINTKENEIIFGTKNTRIPDDVTKISSSAFQYKILDRSPSLKTLVIPNSVISIGDNAFEGCVGLGNVTLGKGMNYIPENMFLGCENLHNVVIPSSYDTIGNNAFKDCSHLESIYFGCSKEDYDSGKIQMDLKTKNQLEMVNKYYDWSI